MTSRTFQFRLRSSHGGPELTSQSVELERLSEDGDWQPQNPSLDTPPFRLHLIALLLCLHVHLVSEARDRHIPRIVSRMTCVVSRATASHCGATRQRNADLQSVPRQPPWPTSLSPDTRARAIRRGRL